VEGFNSSVKGLRKGEDIHIWRRKLYIALCGGLDLEEALDLSWDRLQNKLNFSHEFFSTGRGFPVSNNGNRVYYPTAALITTLTSSDTLFRKTFRCPRDSPLYMSYEEQSTETSSSYSMFCPIS
jgi:hypothetical protein